MPKGNDKTYELYLKERESLLGFKAEGSKQFDKSILTFSAGALAISITFLEKIAKTPIACKYLLIFSWLCFVISIMFTIISFLISQKACDEQIKILEDYLLKKGSLYENVYTRWTSRLNLGSGCMFSIGILLLTLFSIFNLKEG